MGKKSKRFGKGFEYEVRDILREATGDDSFERVPDSGAFFGGANKIRAETSREDLVEIMSGDLICPPGWRWVCECKNYEDVPYHQLFLGNGCKLIDEFLQQVHQDAITSKKEPLLFMKIRRKPWKLSKKAKDSFKEAGMKIPQSNSKTLGILVAELANKCTDIAGINHIKYTGSLENGTCATWLFFDLQNWLEYVNDRTS